ncbi:MAG: N-acetyltransferase [Acidobacteriia bacterium]|nr:N-acetyltransferase [Terriglobia bacterium]
MSEQQASEPQQHQPQQRELKIRHNRTLCRFEAGSSRNPAHLDYLLAESLMEIFHTEVPSDYQGQGLAGKLATAALAWARENKYKVLATCSYVHAFMAKRPEYQDLL